MKFVVHYQYIFFVSHDPGPTAGSSGSRAPPPPPAAVPLLLRAPCPCFYPCDMALHSDYLPTTASGTVAVNFNH